MYDSSLVDAGETNANNATIHRYDDDDDDDVV